MEFEIKIIGKKEPLASIPSMLKEYPIRNLSLKELTYSKENSLLLIYTDEESLNDVLTILSYILKELKYDYPDFDTEFKVKNLSYSEPEFGKGHEGPIMPTENIRILTPEIKDSYKDESISIVINSNNAFGSGTHPSTVLCLQELECLSGIRHKKTNWLNGKKVLDFGCGSGILAIASVKLGARCAVGIEIDPNSVKTARDNVCHNNLTEKVEILEGSWDRLEGQFELIVANLVPSTLLKASNYLFNYLSHGGRIIISGFQAEQSDTILKPYVRAGLRLLKRESLDGWCSLLFEKSKNPD